jgi:hypothetical protein
LFDVKLYTGNGSTQTISGLGFSPDLVWIKSRSGSFFHRLYDTIRGTTKALYSNSTDTEGLYQSDYENFTAFNSDGFSLGAATIDDGINNNGSTFVAWSWDAGSSTVTNTQGSISSQVRANASAGFSVVTYTGSTGNYTFGHGLGMTPKLVLIKNRSNSANWFVITNATGSWLYGHLNLTDALAGAAQSANSTVVDLVSNAFNWFNANGDNYVAYCFAPVAGYSSFGSYTGNGSTDGPFVYTGFRPRFILARNATNATGVNWHIYDTSRDTYNVSQADLYPNSSSSEQVSAYFDILSNGFKVRIGGQELNGSGQTIIYACFAESPFQYARAR